MTFATARTAYLNIFSRHSTGRCTLFAERAPPCATGQRASAPPEPEALYAVEGLAGVAFCVISRRRLLALPPRARVHHKTIGEAMKIEE